jgi:hypothetical protein
MVATEKHPSGVKTPSFSCAYLARLKPCPDTRLLAPRLAGRPLNAACAAFFVSQKTGGWLPRVAAWANFICSLRERVGARLGPRESFSRNGGDGCGTAQVTPSSKDRSMGTPRSRALIQDFWRRDLLDGFWTRLARRGPGLKPGQRVRAIQRPEGLCSLPGGEARELCWLVDVRAKARTLQAEAVP